MINQTFFTYHQNQNHTIQREGGGGGGGGGRRGNHDKLNFF